MPTGADCRDRVDDHWSAELCQYVGDKDDGSEKRICGLSESWDDNQTVTMALADRGLASCGSFDRDFAASNLPGDLVWDAGSFFTAEHLVYDLSLYAGSPMGSSAASAVVGSRSPPDVLPFYRKRKHYRAFADC